MPSRKHKKKSLFSDIPLFKVLLLIALVALAGLSLFLAIRMTLPLPQAQSISIRQQLVTKPAPPAAPLQPAANDTSENTPDTTNSTDLQYETNEDDFDATIRTVDAVILQALGTLDPQHKNLHHRTTVEARMHDGQEFYYQNITIGPAKDAFPFVAELKKHLTRQVPDARLTVLDENPRNLEITIAGVPTHHLFLPLLLPTELAKPEASSPKIVIIIDDMGQSVATATRLAALPFPVSVSVLPYTNKAREVARIARQHDLELLLHLPCEPIGYPRKANSGPGSILASMNPATIENTVVADLARLPDVDGVNNHMGSRLTQDTKAMQIILAHLKGRGKFFVDSMTTPKSVGSKVAASLGMKHYRRHIFLDNTQSERIIALQLQKAESLARRSGLAIVIGHPYPATLDALEAWASTRDTTIHLCRIQDI